MASADIGADQKNRRFVAAKIFAAKYTAELKLDDPPRPSVVEHRGKQHIELTFDLFVEHGPGGQHFCEVVEPLGCSLRDILENVFERRVRLNQPKGWLGTAAEGDGWSAKVAKRACWQILLGLDYLHSQRIAHRDIYPANVCAALDYDLCKITENEIQQAVWATEAVKAPEEQTNDKELDSVPSGGKKARERQERISEQWRTVEAGDIHAEPHSVEWKKANFFNLRDHIQLAPCEPGSEGGIDYSVKELPLDEEAELPTEQPFRIVLIDLGFARPFDECEQHPLRTQSDFRPPEALIGLPATYKADIFSLGLLFWEVIMLRRLVEATFFSDDVERTQQKNRLLRDLAQRLGPVPAALRARWRDANEYVDSDGSALDMQERDETTYDLEDFEFGDIWHHARRRKPIDMGDSELEVFVGLILQMLRWEPEARPSTHDLLQHEWFSDM
ncbi:kinase-like protein [Thozetella sp. PMI_491]|nr:kinase-like protein [Thozetella sp. PMI_491]